MYLLQISARIPEKKMTGFYDFPTSPSAGVVPMK
jgi:hypothetical protein